jgi:hypothetical protein
VRDPGHVYLFPGGVRLTSEAQALGPQAYQYEKSDFLTIFQIFLASRKHEFASRKVLGVGIWTNGKNVDVWWFRKLCTQGHFSLSLSPSLSLQY